MGSRNVLLFGISLQFVFLFCLIFLETNAVDAKTDLTNFLLGRILTIGDRLDKMEERFDAQNSVSANDIEAIRQDIIDAVVKDATLKSHQVSKAFGVEKTNIRAKSEEMSHLTKANRNEIIKIKEDSNQIFIEMSNLNQSIVGLQSDFKNQLANQMSRDSDKTERQIKALSDRVTDIQLEVNEIQRDTKEMKNTLVCPNGWSRQLDSCILYVIDGIRSWSDAQKHCKLKQGRLAEPYTDESFDLLIRNAPDSPDRWYLGASDRDREGRWVWEKSSKPMELKRWRNGEPNNSGDEDCLEVRGQGLNDVRCSTKLHFICETYLLFH